MGFALWIEEHVAWASGTHEYRPMGSAVVAAGSVFTARDFRLRQTVPSRGDLRFIGLFASLGDMNHWLQSHSSRQGRSPRIKIIPPRRKSPVIPTV